MQNLQRGAVGPIVCAKVQSASYHKGGLSWRNVLEDRDTDKHPYFGYDGRLHFDADWNVRRRALRQETTLTYWTIWRLGLWR